MSLRQALHALNHQCQAQCDRDIDRVGASGGLIELPGDVAPAPSFAAIVRQVLSINACTSASVASFMTSGTTSGRGNGRDEFRRGRLLGMRPNHNAVAKKTKSPNGKGRRGSVRHDRRARLHPPSISLARSRGSQATIGAIGNGLQPPIGAPDHFTGSGQST